MAVTAALLVAVTAALLVAVTAALLVVVEAASLPAIPATAAAASPAPVVEVAHATQPTKRLNVHSTLQQQQQYKQQQQHTHRLRHMPVEAAAYMYTTNALCRKSHACHVCLKQQ